MWNEFKEFAFKGNVIDLAVGIIIGAAFGKVVSSLVNDVLMPPIGKIFGAVDFASLYLNLSSQQYASMDAAVKAGAPIIKYGLFLNNTIDFLIVAFVVFMMVKSINKVRREKPEPEPDTRECPFCLSVIPDKAVRCAHCTSELKQ